MIWALHGAVGMAQDWDSSHLQKHFFKTVNLWRFLECCPMPMEKFGKVLNGENKQSDNVLLGYSMGGRLALHSLLDEDSQWDKAIIVSAHTGLQPEQRAARRSKDAEWASLALTSNWETFIQQWNSQSILPQTTKIKLTDRRLLRTSRKQVARSFIDWSTGAQEDLLDRLSEIQIPVLWITGEQDLKFCEIAEQAVKVLPKGTHQIIKNSGHRVPWEQPETFYQLVNDFLENQVRGGDILSPGS